MPNTKSARKALRVSERRTIENRKTKVAVRQIVKKATAENIPEVFSVLDKAAKNHAIHANKAARIKSRLSKILDTTVKAPKEEKKETKKTTKKTTKSTKKA